MVESKYYVTCFIVFLLSSIVGTWKQILCIVFTFKLNNYYLNWINTFKLNGSYSSIIQLGKNYGFTLSSTVETFVVHYTIKLIVIQVLFN